MSQPTDPLIAFDEAAQLAINEYAVANPPSGWGVDATDGEFKAALCQAAMKYADARVEAALAQVMPLMRAEMEKLWPGVTEGRNHTMTGHGALDFAHFAVEALRKQPEATRHRSDIVPAEATDVKQQEGRE